MNTILNENTDYSHNNLIYQELKCGLCNKILILFNIISLSKELNKNFILYFNETNEKYKKKYNFFKNIQYSNKLLDENKKYFFSYKEKNNIYKKIPNIDQNIILNGYFQSYKYFWNYIEEIKKYLYLDYELINKIKNYYLKFNNNILAIHIRLGDYLINPDKFPIPSITYFKYALSLYDLNKYQIILFSDNLDLASEILNPLNLNFIKASEFSECDEDQLYMLMLSNIRICSNSTYSLVSCYLNEMYNFIEKSEYIFPNIWFHDKFIKYNMHDLMINNKFIKINLKFLNYKNNYDVITPLHKKDFENYKKYLSTNIKNLNNSNNIYYISDIDYKINKSNFINENLYPFSKEDIKNYLKNYINKERINWYYQQFLKLYIFRINKQFKDYVLILDSDIILLKQFSILKEKPILYYINLKNNKTIHKPYINSINYLFPNIKVEKNKSSICHHMLFNKKILNNLLDLIENRFNKPAWVSICDSIIYYLKNNIYNISIFSEYELYYNFILNYYKNNYEFKTNINFIDINISKFDWINKKDLNFIGNHSWKK